MKNADCIFCKIVAGEAPSHTVWEDDQHIAFLSIFPNTPGFTVVATKEHYPSYVFDAPDEVMTGLVRAAKKVAQRIDARLEDVGRTGLVFEGFGVDHLHAKLIPLHGTADMQKWQPIEKKLDTFFEHYPGYMSTHDSQRADDAELKKIAKKIRGE